MVCMNLETTFVATDTCERASEGEMRTASGFVCLANESVVGLADERPFK